MNRDQMLIEADELLTKVDDPNLRIYDATILFYRKKDEPTAYEQYLQGHIPGAAFFDHQAFSDSTSIYAYMVPPKARLAKQIGTISIGESSEVIVYANDLLPCATRSWWLLCYAVHDKVQGARP